MAKKSIRLAELQRQLAGDYPSALLLFRAGAFAQTFNEDALILHKGLEYKLVLLGGDKPYLRVGFPWNSIALKAERIQDKLQLDMQRAARFSASGNTAWVLQTDLSKYFFSIRHDRLLEILARRVRCLRLMQLFADLLDSFHTGSEFDALFPPEHPFLACHAVKACHWET